MYAMVYQGPPWVYEAINVKRERKEMQVYVALFLQSWFWPKVDHWFGPI